MRYFKTEPNEKASISKVAMKNDETNPKIPDPIGNWGSFTILIGPPGSGKTNLAWNMLLKKSMWRKKFDHVEIWSPSLHTAPDIDLPEEQLHDTFDPEDFQRMVDKLYEDDKHTLFFLDDMMTEISTNLPAFMKAVANRRHASRSGGGSLTLAFVTQDYIQIPRPLRKMVTHIALFRTQNMREVDTVYQELFSFLKKEDFLKILETCWDVKHGFMWANFKKPRRDMFYCGFDKVELPESLFELKLTK